METKALVDYFQSRPNIHSDEYRQQVKELIAKANEVRQENGWSKRQMAKEAGIEPGTFRHWFGNNPRKPSLPHAVQLAQFLSRQKLSRQESHVKNGAPENSEMRWRLQKLRTLLRMIDEELEWFQASKDRRERLRDEIPTEAIGYLGSQLSMLTDEDRYLRWQQTGESCLEDLLT